MSCVLTFYWKPPETRMKIQDTQAFSARNGFPALARPASARVGIGMMEEIPKTNLQGVESARESFSPEIFFVAAPLSKFIRCAGATKTPVIYGLSGPRPRYPVKSLS
jgi:hypothetical protein